MLKKALHKFGATFALITVCSLPALANQETTGTVTRAVPMDPVSEPCPEGMFKCFCGSVFVGCYNSIPMCLSRCGWACEPKVDLKAETVSVCSPDLPESE